MSVEHLLCLFNCLHFGPVGHHDQSDDFNAICRHTVPNGIKRSL
jgi:hypothetical protein